MLEKHKGVASLPKGRGTEQQTRTSTCGALSVNRAFVVQFRDQGEQAEQVSSDRPDRVVYVGRAEHIASGQAAEFQSWADLQGFLELVLSQQAEEET